MGIQPIDLQTMYSQLSNVSKTLSGPQQAVLSEEMQQQNKIQKNLEANTKVQKSSNENADSARINSDGRGSGGAAYASYGNQKKYEQPEQEGENSSENKPRPDYLGNIIDISR